MKRTDAPALARMRALGRLKQGQRNKTEQAYEAHLEQRRIAGEIVWYKFEAMKFRLADNTFYTPDFIVMDRSGFLEAHEVKGSRRIFMDDAKVKIKVACDMYPVSFLLAFAIPKSKGGGFEIERLS